jgi:curli biogenesis system outer membrane secretion channel CsgG
LEKIILVERFHGQYIVIGIQVVNVEGSEVKHVHSIVVKVGDGRAQFNVDGMLENLSSTSQVELAELLQSKYSS